METPTAAFTEIDAVPYNRLPESDDSRLNRLGYKQELRRTLSAIANFSVTFSIISILTGITTLYNQGLTYGGPVAMVYGWPIVGVMTFTVALSMAEIISAYPTSGGLYYWAAKLCSQDWAPFASWLTGWVKIIDSALGYPHTSTQPYPKYNIRETIDLSVKNYYEFESLRK